MTFLRLMKMPKHPDREQDGGDREIVGEADRHSGIPSPLLISTSRMPVGRRARGLVGDALPAHVGAVAEREHDRPDHGDQEDQARRLEEVDVVGVEHPPDRLGVGDRAGAERDSAGGRAAGGHADRDRRHLDDQDQRHDAADRQVAGEAGPELGEIDVQHHHHEQEEDGDGADVDDHQDHGQELGAQQHEEAGGREEGRDQEEHRVHGIAGADHEQRRPQRRGRQNVEGYRLQGH